MANLYKNPVFSTFENVTIEGQTSGQFSVRIYYPTETGNTGVVRPGHYPLIIFAHGSRSNQFGVLCPDDITRDYQRWRSVVTLWARCGFIVASPSMEPFFVPERIEDTVRWMRREWRGKEHLQIPGDFPTDVVPLSGERLALPEDILAYSAPLNPFPDPIPGWPTPLGLVGHSYGARACAMVASRGVVTPNAIANIAGIYDDNESPAAIRGFRKPTLLIGGADFEALSYMTALWQNLSRPKHQVAVQGLSHWDWFGIHGLIRRCESDPDNENKCPIGWQIASELVLGFFTKYLRKFPAIPPYLLGKAGNRPPLLPWFDQDSKCAIKIRWDDPLSSNEPMQLEKVYGTWRSNEPAW